MQGDLAFLRLVTNHREDECQWTFGEVLEVEVTRLVGEATQSRAFYLHINKRKMLARVSIQHVARNMGI